MLLSENINTPNTWSSTPHMVFGRKAFLKALVLSLVYRLSKNKPFQNISQTNSSVIQRKKTGKDRLFKCNVPQKKELRIEVSSKYNDELKEK